jgi:hypothetical protein
MELAQMLQDYSLLSGGREYRVVRRVLASFCRAVYDQDPAQTSHELRADLPDDFLSQLVSVLNFGEELFPTGSLAILPLIGSSLDMVGYDDYCNVSSEPDATVWVSLFLSPALLSCFPTFGIVTLVNTCTVPTFFAALSPLFRARLDSGNLRFDYADESPFFRYVSDYLTGSPITFTAKNSREVHRIASELQLTRLRDATAIFLEHLTQTKAILGVHQEDLEPLASLQEDLLGVSLTNSAELSEKFLKSVWFSETEKIKEFVSNLLIACKGHLRKVPAFVSLTSAICGSPGGSFFRGFLTKRLLALLGDEYLLPVLVALADRGLIEMREIVAAIYGTFVSKGGYAFSDLRWSGLWVAARRVSSASYSRQTLPSYCEVTRSLACLLLVSA